MSRRVIVIGSLNYDICMKQERLPEEGETYCADSVEYCSGGKGGNQAVQAAKLGLETYMAGCIGDDESGKFLKANMEKYGVHTDWLKTVHGQSGMSVATSLYDGGIRASIVHGANFQVTTEDIDGLANFLQPQDLVVFQLEIPVPIIEYAIRICKSKNCYVILNAAPAVEISYETRKQVDMFIVNEVEAAFYAKTEIPDEKHAMKEVSKMAQELENICIFTLGKAGSVVCKGERCEFVPSLKVHAVESTGAGDSFVGGICYGLIHHMDIFEAVRFATCCGAKTVEKTGGQPAMPYLDEVMELYQR